MNANMNLKRSVFAEHALLPTGWERDVVLEWGEAGILGCVRVGATAPADAQRAAGPVIPGMPNLHSHAFQRAFAGLTEYRGQAQDSFWSWRTLMYRFAGSVTPAQLEAIATGLYVEMLEAGYTSVCEFHYLHHQGDGQPYADDAELSRRLLAAAARAGIGLTLLPVLYQTAGFDAAPARAEQRRFVRSTESMLRLLQTLRPLCEAQGARLGLAPHSLRAVPPESLRDALAGLDGIDATAPVHIHVAEQTAEVDACVAARGQRPLEWLLDHAPVGPRWCLVHATHMTPAEARTAARSGAVAGICPTTEANLGDGFFDVPTWRAAHGRWGVGSDSHATVEAAEELRLLEYGQRLLARQRNVMATDDQRWVATAMTLEAVGGGAQASGRPVGGLAAGQRADFVVLDAAHPLLSGLAIPDAMLSAHVFAGHRRSAIESVWVGGQQRVTCGRHALHEPAAAGLSAARQALASLV